MRTAYRLNVMCTAVFRLPSRSVRAVHSTYSTRLICSLTLLWSLKHRPSEILFSSPYKQSSLSTSSHRNTLTILEYKIELMGFLNLLIVCVYAAQLSFAATGAFRRAYSNSTAGVIPAAEKRGGHELGYAQCMSSRSLALSRI